MRSVRKLESEEEKDENADYSFALLAEMIGLVVEIFSGCTLAN